MEKKSNLAVVVRRTRKSVRTEVNTGGAVSRKTQCGGTIVITSYTLDTSYAPQP